MSSPDAPIEKRSGIDAIFDANTTSPTLRPKPLALPVMNQTLNMKSSLFRTEHSHLGAKRIRRDFLRPESPAAGQPDQHPLFLKGTLLRRARFFQMPSKLTL
jgi:hypothetical protein